MIEKIIYQLISFMRSNDESTDFFSRVKHNADLCPRYLEQLEKILQAFEKYQSIAYDIQGPKDRGTDVVVKMPSEGEEINHICLQIKSEDDLKNGDYLKILKAQYFDATRTYKNILDYYILLCCDARKNKEKIRSVAADFSHDKNVHVIIPEYSLNFYRLGLIQIDALIKAKLGSEDIVYNKALDLVGDIIPTERAILFYLIWKKVFENKDVLSFEDIYNADFIRNVYHIVPDYVRAWFFFEDESIEEDEDNESDFKEIDQDGIEEELYDVAAYTNEYEIRGYDIMTRISHDLDYLEDQFFDQDDFGSYRLDISLVYPLITLMVDGHLRYEYTGKELLSYMMDLFAPMKGYDSLEAEKNIV